MIAYRKRLKDAAALEALLEREGVQLLLHGHRHQNQRSERLGARIFCTAPASAEDACFRSFDIDRDGSGWTVQASLVQRHGGRFEDLETECWRVSAPG